MLRSIRKLTRLSALFATVFVAAYVAVALAQEPDEAQQNARKDALRAFSAELWEKRSEGLDKGAALSGRIEKLKSSKRDALRWRFESVKRAYDVGVRGYDMAALVKARSEWIDAELEMSTDPAQRAKWLRQLVDDAVEMEEEVLAKSDANAAGGDHATLAAAHADRFDAELRLAEELAAQRKAKK